MNALVNVFIVGLSYEHVTIISFPFLNSFPAPPTIIPYSSFVNEITGQSVEMGIVITRGTPSIQLSWSFIGVPINTMNRYSLLDDGKSLVISNVSFKDIGVYVITASNPAGKTSTEIALDILGQCVIIIVSITIIDIVPLTFILCIWILLPW